MPKGFWGFSFRVWGVGSGVYMEISPGTLIQNSFSIIEVIKRSLELKNPVYPYTRSSLYQ